MMVDIITYLSKLIERMVPRVNPKVNYGRWVILTCQGRVINCNKWTTVVEDVDSGRCCECVGDREYLRTLYFLLNFAVNPQLV